jgi:glycosyltransferase involved in cell wall biosynthesis
MDENILASIIIISYKRKEFIKEAVNSVLNQDIDRNKYEIIVVKDFYDSRIDEFLFRTCDLVINHQSETNGEKWTKGLTSSRGKVICFLDDDDLFHISKLSRILEVYSETKFDYYHNSSLFFRWT